MKTLRTLLTCTLLSAMLFAGCSKSNDAAAPPAANYTNVKITSLSVTSLPMTKSNGGGWQSNSGPNVYFKITDPTNTVLYTGSTYSNVSAGSLPLSWNFTQAFQITNLNTTYTIMFYNHNAILSDDQMGGYYFTMADFKNGFPTVVPISSPQSQVALKFSTVWY